MTVQKKRTLDERHWFMVSMYWLRPIAKSRRPRQDTKTFL